MAILPKETLEYQRALFELPKFLFTGITIFSTAASFLIRDRLVQPSSSLFFSAAFVIGMGLTFWAFMLAYSVVSHTVDSMRRANTSEEAEQRIEIILSGIYSRFGLIGGLSVVYWLLLIVLIVLMR